MHETGQKPLTAYVDLGYRGVDADNPEIAINHRGKFRTPTDQERKLLKRRQAIEPIIGHLKVDHRMDSCYLKGEQGDRPNAVKWDTIRTPNDHYDDRHAGLAQLVERYLAKV